jgi:hypothetical protein
MTTIRKLINDYGEIIDFNRQLANFLLNNEHFLSKHDGRNYSQKTLLEAMPNKLAVNIGIKLKKLPISLVENKDSDKTFIFNSQIHCISDKDKGLFFGFSMNLLLGDEDSCLDFTIAYMKPSYTDYKIKPIRLNHKKRMITDQEGRVIIFSSRKDFRKVIDFCQQKIQQFNEHLPSDNQLIVNINF